MAEPESPEQKEMLRRLQIQHDEIISGVGLVTRVWAQLESALCDLFRVLGNIPEKDRDLAGVIFYTPSNTETRISFVANLVTYRCDMHKIGELDDRLRALWGKLKGKIDYLKNTRNRIIHGTIVTSSIGPLDQRIRLSPAIADTLRFAPYLRQRRHPGLGPGEIKNHEQAVWRVNERTQRLNEAFRLRMQLQFGPHQGGEIQKLLELLTQLESQTNSQNSQDQEPPEKTDPYQSSPE
jgi:hypothetical protein